MCSISRSSFGSILSKNLTNLLPKNKHAEQRQEFAFSLDQMLQVYGTEIAGDFLMSSFPVGDKFEQYLLGSDSEEQAPDLCHPDVANP
jgi:hypothetical protein